jgi:hypothetical protein
MSICYKWQQNCYKDKIGNYERCVNQCWLVLGFMLDQGLGLNLGLKTKIDRSNLAKTRNQQVYLNLNPTKTLNW